MICPLRDREWRLLDGELCRLKRRLKHLGAGSPCAGPPKTGQGADALPRLPLERFRAKWIPVRVKKMRQNKNLEPGSDLIRTDKALDDLACAQFRDRLRVIAERGQHLVGVGAERG